MVAVAVVVAVVGVVSFGLVVVVVGGGEVALALAGAVEWRCQVSRKIIEVSSKYTTKDGQAKWSNTIVGSAFVRDDGSISLLLNPGISIASLEGVRITVKEPFVRDEQRPPRAVQTAMPTDGGDLPDWMK